MARRPYIGNLDLTMAAVRNRTDFGMRQPDGTLMEFRWQEDGHWLCSTCRVDRDGTKRLVSSTLLDQTVLTAMTGIWPCDN